MDEAKPYIKYLFYEEGENKTTPNCKVKIVPDFDPTNGTCVFHFMNKSQ